jgi:hypothetical protein
LGFQLNAHEEAAITLENKRVTFSVSQGRSFHSLDLHSFVTHDHDIQKSLSANIAFPELIDNRFTVLAINLFTNNKKTWISDYPKSNHVNVNSDHCYAVVLLALCGSGWQSVDPRSHLYRLSPAPKA